MSKPEGGFRPMGAGAARPCLMEERGKNEKPCGKTKAFGVCAAAKSGGYAPSALPPLRPFLHGPDTDNPGPPPLSPVRQLVY
jgi:hypothetical protein